MGNKGSKNPPVNANTANTANKEIDGPEEVNYSQAENMFLGGKPQKSSATLRILNDKPENKDKKTVAVIITICNGSTYDGLFASVEQKAIEGTKVEVYACSAYYLDDLVEAFEGKPRDNMAARLMKSVGEVDPDCVVLNWECCSGYDCKQFTEGEEKLFYFLKKVIDRGHMAMFSDFSLKALVNSWKDKYKLGPNPFVQTTEHTGHFVIRFKPSDLKECPSAQLQIVGDMAEDGACNVHAAGGTIVYAVDQNKLKHNNYKLQVLTVVTTIVPST
jgi:hypothetical protein